MGDLQDLNDSTAAGFAAVGDVLRRQLIPVTANRVVTADDRNATLLVNDVTAGTLTITLPAIVDFEQGHTLWVQIARVNGVAQGAGLKRTFINCAAGDRFGVDEPTFAISAVTNNGAGLKRVTLQEQRLFSISNGFPNVIITGAGGGANGIWPANRPLVEDDAPFNIDLQGSVYTVTAGAGGTARAIRTQMLLQYSTSWVKLTAWIDPNGIGRWLFKGSMDTGGRADMGMGDNGASSPLAYRGYSPSPGNAAPIMDFAYSGAAARTFTRSVVALEYGDPPELAFGRYSSYMGDGIGVYPDGPGYTTSYLSEAIGTIHASPSVAGNSLIGRGAQIGFRTVETPSLTARGCSIVMYSVTPGTNTMVERITTREKVSVGPEQTTAFFGVTDGSGSAPTGWFRNSNSAPATVVRVTSAGSGNNARSLMVMESADGADTEFRFSETGNGLCDGSWTGGGADYAEIFEWWDGNPSGEDRVGKAVVLVTGEAWDDVLSPGVRRKFDAYRIRLADTLSDEDSASIFGAVSSNPNIKGGGGELRWDRKFSTDALGRVETEEAAHVAWTVHQIEANGRRGDVEPNFVTKPQAFGYFIDVLPEGVQIPPDKIETLAQAIDRTTAEYEGLRERQMTGKIVSPEQMARLAALKSWTWTSGPVRTTATRRKLNPDFDPSLEYEPRSIRPEWDYIGLLGQVAIYEGQPVNPNWIYIGDVSEGVELWLVR